MRLFRACANNLQVNKNKTEHNTHNLSVTQLRDRTQERVAKGYLFLRQLLFSASFKFTTVTLCTRIRSFFCLSKWKLWLLRFLVRCVVVVVMHLDLDRWKWNQKQHVFCCCFFLLFYLNPLRWNSICIYMIQFLSWSSLKIKMQQQQEKANWRRDSCFLFIYFCSHSFPFFIICWMKPHVK